MFWSSVPMHVCGRGRPTAHVGRRGGGGFVQPGHMHLVQSEIPRRLPWPCNELLLLNLPELFECQDSGLISTMALKPAPKLPTSTQTGSTDACISHHITCRHISFVTSSGSATATAPADSHRHQYTLLPFTPCIVQYRYVLVLIR